MSKRTQISKVFGLPRGITLVCILTYSQELRKATWLIAWAHKPFGFSGKELETCEWTIIVWCEQGRNQLFISGGGNFHEISFDDVTMLIQPWYNFFANGHRQSFFETFPKMRTFSFNQDADRTTRTE